MKTIKVICGIIVAGTLSACSVGGQGGSETYTDDGGYFGQAPSSPVNPTGLGIDKVKTVYVRPGSKTKEGAIPPVGYTEQWWTDPETNCEYSRASYGGQVNWTLILNPPGKPWADPSCKKHFVSEGPMAPGYRHVGNGYYEYDRSLDPMLQPRPMTPMDAFE